MIRTAEARDAAAWATMRHRLWPHHDRRELEDGVAAFFDGHNRDAFIDVAFICEDGSAQPVGFIELSIRDFADGCDSRPIPHVEGWYVEPHAQRCGFGRALMQAAEAWARERSFTELASDAHAENRASRDAHAGCGFSETEILVKFRKALA